VPSYLLFMTTAGTVLCLRRRCGLLAASARLVATYIHVRTREAFLAHLHFLRSSGVLLRRRLALLTCHLFATVSFYHPL